jgi:hypothetical protein
VPHNPLGVVILNTDDMTRDLERLKRLRPHAVTFTQQAFGMIKPALDAVPELKVATVRTIRDDEKTLHEGGDPLKEKLLDDFENLLRYENLDRERTYLAVWNEPNLTTADAPDKLAWTVDIMRKARARNIHLSVLGIPMATLSRNHWQSGIFDALLRECEDQYHVLRVDEYGGPILWAGAAGRLPDVYLDPALAQEENAPSPYDVQEGSRSGDWYIGRLFDIVERCEQLGIRLARIGVGECGNDHMGDLEHAKLSDGRVVNIFEWIKTTFGIPWPHWNVRGWNTLRNYWAFMFPGKSAAKMYVAQLSWQLWVYSKAVEYVQVFASCPGDEKWDKANGFNLSQDQEWWDRASAVGDRYLDETPEPEPEPEPPTEVMPVLPWALLLMGLIMAIVIVGGLLYAA